jgi:Mg2+-importing ATPase
LAAKVTFAGARLILPFLPLAGILGFCPLSILFLFVLGAVVATYILAAEVTKKLFQRRVRF